MINVVKYVVVCSNIVVRVIMFIIVLDMKDVILCLVLLQLMYYACYSIYYIC